MADLGGAEPACHPCLTRVSAMSHASTLAALPNTAAVTAVSTPTDQWRSHASDLPPLPPGSALDTAERLLLLVHYCIDWQGGWITGRHRARYWDHVLPTRVRAATYRSDDLHSWWSTVAAALQCTPQNAQRRAEVVELLVAPSEPVLAVMRDSLPALLLRVRIIAEAVAASRKDSQ